MGKTRFSNQPNTNFVRGFRTIAACSVSALALLGTQSALAQESSAIPAATSNEEIVVTGSYIITTSFAQSSPVDVVSSAAMLKASGSGYKTMQLIDIGYWYHNSNDVPDAVSPIGLERVARAYIDFVTDGDKPRR